MRFDSLSSTPCSLCFYLVWNQIKDRLVRSIEAEKKRKRDELIRARKNTLFAKLKPHYDELVSEQDETTKLWYPTLRDLDKIPAVDIILGEDDAQIELTPERIQNILDIVETHVATLQVPTEQALLAQLRETYASVSSICGEDVDLPETLDRKYLHYAISRFRCSGNHSYCQGKRSYSYKGLLKHLRVLSRSDTEVHVEDVKGAYKAFKILGLPRDLFFNDMPDAFVCDCLKPGLSMPLQFDMLLSHLRDEKEFHDTMMAHA